MLHDTIAARTATVDAPDRRGAARVPCPAEVTLAWLHAPENPMRFGLLDVSAGGYRIRSSVPLLTGATAIVLRLLPEGQPLEHVVAVAWCRERGSGYEVGLRRVSA